MKDEPIGKHTAGPWLSQQHGDDYVCKGPNGERVLNIRNGVIPMKADRRLIDAAPELLDACRDIASAQSQRDIGLATAKAVAALAKATGGAEGRET